MGAADTSALDDNFCYAPRELCMENKWTLWLFYGGILLAMISIVLLVNSVALHHKVGRSDEFAVLPNVGHANPLITLICTLMIAWPDRTSSESWKMHECAAWVVEFQEKRDASAPTLMDACCPHLMLSYQSIFHPS